MSRIDPKLQEVLTKYHPSPKDALWNCHGTWVAYHKDLEIVAKNAKITFDPPQIVEAKGEHKVAAICVIGHMNGTAEWSIGEAAPQNNKNNYPWAMAEKRARDRVILKLVGLHGLVYSEEEADEFKHNAPPPKEHGNAHGPLKITELKEKLRVFTKDVADCTERDQLDALVASHKELLEQCARDLPGWWYGRDGSDVKGIGQRIAERQNELNTVLGAG